MFMLHYDIFVDDNILQLIRPSYSIDDICIAAKWLDHLYMSRVVRKPAFCICENKDADQLRGNREADQRLCFRYIDSTIPLLPSSHLVWLYSLVCVRPGRKPRRPVFSQRGSYNHQIFHLIL